MPGQPYLALYVGDWRKDPAVQSLNYEGRGVWMEILFFMHESPERGRLILNGRALTDDEIARMIGIPEADGEQIISKLLANGVASRDDDTGALMCRRMVREAMLSDVRADAGRKGGLASGKQVGSKEVSKRGSKVQATTENDIDNEGSLEKEDSKENNLIFDTAWFMYPKRAGSNPKKAAEKAWLARLKEGVSGDDLLNATLAYAKECDEMGKVGTEYVKQASTFYGPNEHWKEYIEKQQEQVERQKKRAEDLRPLPELSDEEREAQREAIQDARQQLRARR